MQRKPVSVARAAQLAGVNPETVRRWIRAGRLIPVERVMVRNLLSALVDPRDVKRLAAAITSGRPKRVG